MPCAHHPHPEERPLGRVSKDDDIAGQGIANPIGMIWSGAMMLEHLGEKTAGAAIVSAIERTLGERTLRTKDLGGNADTAACGKAVAEMVE